MGFEHYCPNYGLRKTSQSNLNSRNCSVEYIEKSIANQFPNEKTEIFLLIVKFGWGKTVNLFGKLEISRFALTNIQRLCVFRRWGPRALQNFCDLIRFTSKGTSKHRLNIFLNPNRYFIKNMVFYQ